MRATWPLVTVLASVFLATLAPAQEGQWRQQQEEDGRWSAELGGGRAQADLRVTTWMTLAILGDGSKTDAQAYARMLKASVNWLLAQQDGAGRIGLRADPDWLLD